MNQRMDTCPECGSFPSEIRGGNEFRVVSLADRRLNNKPELPKNLKLNSYVRNMRMRKY